MGDITRTAGSWGFLGFGALLLALLQAPAARGEVRIAAPDEPADPVVIDLQDAKLEEFLASLSEQFGIEVQIKSAPSAGSLNGTFKGHLSALLPRILRGQDYLLVRGEAKIAGSDGIERIVLLKSAKNGNGGLVSQRNPARERGLAQSKIDAAAQTPPGTDTQTLLNGNRAGPSGLHQVLQPAFATASPPDDPRPQEHFASEEEQAEVLVRRAREQINQIADRMQQVCVASGRCSKPIPK